MLFRAVIAAKGGGWDIVIRTARSVRRKANMPGCGSKRVSERSFFRSITVLNHKPNEVMEHNLHKTIGDILSDAFPELEIVKDPACGGDHLVSLFCNEQKSRETKYADVDMIILKDGKVKVIIEIEESDIRPVYICGKFLVSALSNYFIHDRHGVIEMDDSVLFLQILDSSKLKNDGTSKLEQFKNLEKSIQSVIPLKDSSIDSYRIFYGDVSEFVNGETKNELIDCIREALK